MYEKTENKAIERRKAYSNIIIMGNARKQERIGFSLSRCFCILCTTSLMAIIVALVIWYFVLFTQDDPESIASCGDCHCIVGENETCPFSDKPRTNYTLEELDAWTNYEILNPYRLGCNPYGYEETCKTIYH